MTFNPKWLHEYQNKDVSTYKLEDRVDLVTRIFQLKMNELLADMVDNKIFGEVAAYSYVVEWQKRGLPHCHFLIILREKLLTSDQWDSFVRAEIPDAKTEPKLQKLILEHNIHGPCGHLNPKCPCMKDGECSKGFPKQFAEFTHASPDGGYPVYKRNKTDTFIKNGVTLHYGYVVPYNAYLTLKYESHICVEITATVKSVKYLFKYLTKGAQKAILEVEEIRNETKAYLDCLYLNPYEATHHIYSFGIHRMYPNCVRLQIHLPHQQITSKLSMIEECFKTNSLNPDLLRKENKNKIEEYNSIIIFLHF
jgi:hypothetical protein